MLDLTCSHFHPGPPDLEYTLLGRMISWWSYSDICPIAQLRRLVSRNLQKIRPHLKLEFHRENRTHRAASGQQTWCWSDDVSRPDAARCVRFPRWNSSFRLFAQFWLGTLGAPACKQKKSIERRILAYPSDLIRGSPASPLAPSHGILN